MVKELLDRVKRELIRLWPVWLILAASIFFFDFRLVLAGGWRLFLGTLAFVLAHILWKSAFGYIDVKAMIERDDNSLPDAVIIAGVCVLRAFIYGALILGVMANIGGP